MDENGKYPIYGSGGIFGYANQYLFKGPSVLLGRKGTVDKPRLVLNPFWSVDTAYYTKISKKVNHVFFFHLCNQINFDYYIYGSAIPSMTARDLNEIKFPLPQIPEQLSIVRFLDHKTGQIDRFIANRQKQIELLKEQKSGIINKAVTKGINPNTKMKPSGIEWIGEIPVSWIVTKLKFVAKLQSGNAITADDIKEFGDYPVYGGNGLRGFTANYTNDGEYILIGRQGALCGNINYAENKFWASEHAVVAYLRKPTSILWLGELLRTMNLNQYSQAAAQPGLSVDRIKNLPIPCPNYQEQIKIEEFIQNESSNIDTLISKYQKQIDLMQEYRTSIISQAVTGKIDVREWEPRKKKYKTEELESEMVVEK